MKNKLFFISLFLLISVFSRAQDLIIKTDGTTIKGKLISLQNNRFIVLQEDETEITLTRKAVASILFNFTTNNETELPKVDAPKTSKSIEATTRDIVAKSVEPVKVEIPLQIQSPAQVIVPKNTIESPGDVSGLDLRTLVSAPALKEKAVGVGRVAVNICLNSEGQVITAKFKAAGSTTLDADLISIAVQNAKEFKFSKGDPNECGTVTYRFNLD